jgi:hypothetical protein
LSFDVDVCGTVLEQRCSREIGAVPESVGSPFELYQESSGGEHWHSRAHVNRHGEVPLRLRGYRMRSGDTELNGFRASPIVAIRTSEANVALAARRFWEEFPRAVSIAGNRLELGLWPRQFPDDHELQGGEQKTFRLAVAFDDDPVTSVPLAWYRSPLVAATDPEWYSAAQATSFLVPDSEDPHAPYLALVNAALDPEVGFAAKRERIDEYGWRHFGDLYADHEAAGHAGTDPVVSHYNNQYDAIYGFGLRFMKTGDVRWWLPMDELASHVIDIDVYHTTRDKAAYNGGLFWHTQHYTDAGTSTHRTYPRGAELGGGGPSAEHNYSTGLMLHYFLTGNVASREAAVGLARWVLSMDDGARSRFRWIDRGPTGLVSATGSASYHGPGRAPGNSITVLMNAHRLTGDRAFLEKAEELIRRCIHPADDIPARNLLDAERRWYYTVFLQALAEYLERKSELGERDRMFAYARASLLHYARWMMEHEYPYLEKPEILEYPNETWAAQDMRKCDVLDLASRHASDAERPRFLERADFFFRSSTTTLTGMTTRSLTRPLVLMLTHGYMHAWFRRNGLAERLPSTGAHYDFGKPIVFVPQRARAVRRAAILAGIAVSVAILGGFAMW